ncbi:MAG: FAD-dependent oxidoreductase [Nitrospirota bacterium]
MAEPTQIAEIVSLTTLTPHTTELVLRPIEHPLSFKPGQWISLQLPVGDHPPLNRAYSLAEPPSTTGHLTLLFDHVPGGKGSGYLASLKPGDRIPLSGPYGHFVLPDSEPQHLLLIGRYSGLVPLRCMLRSLAGQGSLPSSTLIAQAPTAAEQLYHDEFMALAASESTFRYLPFVSEGPDSHAETVDVIKQIAGNGRQVTPMIAGVKAFTRPLRALLMELGFDRRDVKLETYD